MSPNRISVGCFGPREGRENDCTTLAASGQIPNFALIIATHLDVADLDESILGDLTTEWLNAAELKLSLGQQIKFLGHVPTYLRSQRFKIMKPGI